MSPPESIWANETALAEYYLTSPIPLHPNAGVIVASIAASVLGSYATLLLLGRRTADAGLRNHALLALSAICFAGIAIFGMHFVSLSGFRLVPSPNFSWYIKFAAGFTIMSLFVPLIAIWIAFWFVGNQDELAIWRVAVSGVFTGGTIGLMHYSASFSLPSFSVHYKAYTVVLAIFIAMVSATCALFLFFRFRSQWQENALKRVFCAFGLAAAVCGMHYVGIAGTSYYVRPGEKVGSLGSSKAQSIKITIVVAVLCGAIILLCIGVAAFDLIARREQRKTAHMVVVASAAFDKQGRLLVRPDGSLPLRTVAIDTDMKSLATELDPRSPTFRWIYGLTFNWGAVTPWLPRIRASIQQRRAATQDNRKSRPTEGPSTKELEVNVFKTRFVEAAIELAEELDLPLTSLGVLFDRALMTGTKRAEADKEMNNQSGKPVKMDDESSIHGISLTLPDSEGVMLIVVRELGEPGPSGGTYEKFGTGQSQGQADTADYWQSRGYRMTDTKFFGGVLADKLGVRKNEMDVFLAACKTYAKRGIRPVVASGGVYLGLFGVRDSGSRHGGAEVIVYGFSKFQIPAYRLPEVMYPLSPAMRIWIRENSGHTLHEVLISANQLIARAEADDQRAEADGISIAADSESEALLDFVTALSISAEALGQALKAWPNLFHIARLSPEIIEAPSSLDDSTTPASIIMLETILPSPLPRLTPSVSRSSVETKGTTLQPRGHITNKPPAPFVFHPYSLFAIAQAQMLRVKSAAQFNKDVALQLSKIYLPTAPTDVLAELNEFDPVDTLDGDMSQVNYQKKPATRSKGPLGLGLFSSHGRRHSAATSLRSDAYDQDELEKASSTAAADYAAQAATGHAAIGPEPHPIPSAMRRSKFVLPKGTQGGRPNTGETPTSPAPAYSTIPYRSNGPSSSQSALNDGHRQDDQSETQIVSSSGNTSDGWHQRSLRTLERSESGGALLAREW